MSDDDSLVVEEKGFARRPSLAKSFGQVGISGRERYWRILQRYNECARHDRPITESASRRDTAQKTVQWRLTMSTAATSGPLARGATVETDRLPSTILSPNGCNGIWNRLSFRERLIGDLIFNFRTRQAILFRSNSKIWSYVTSLRGAEKRRRKMRSTRRVGERG